MRRSLEILQTYPGKKPVKNGADGRRIPLIRYLEGVMEGGESSVVMGDLPPPGTVEAPRLHHLLSELGGGVSSMHAQLPGDIHTLNIGTS